MADTSIVDRAGKGSALTSAQYDGNVNSMCGVVEEQTAATYTIAYTDQNKTIQFNRATAIAVTLPSAASIQALIDTGQWRVALKNIGAGDVTVTGPAGTIDGATSFILSRYDSIVLQTDSAGTAWNIIENIALRFAGARRFLVKSGGIAALLSNGDTDTEDRHFRLEHSDGTRRGLIGFDSATTLRFYNYIDSGKVQLVGRDSGSAQSFLLDGDPDGAVSLYYDGSVKIATSNTGVSVTGTVTADTDMTVSSDIALKENFRPLDGALDKLKQIGSYLYDRISTGDRQAGVIAQEVREVLPEAVIGKDGDLSVSTQQLLGLVIAAVNELSRKVDGSNK